MAIETGGSSQNRGLSARRFNIPEAPSIGSLTIPDNVSMFIAKNVGNTTIRMNFNSDSNSDYWELAPGEEFPVGIKVQGATTVNATAMSGSGKIQVIFWG
jgi:hypothetical protein